MTRFGQRAGAVVVTLAVIAGCGGGSGSSKAGGVPPPVTLRIGTDDSPGRPSADAISEFARLVEQRSSGALRIEPVWHADGTDQRNWDQLVARMVVAGQLDMGVIPTRAWDTEGVTSLRALNAPFLVTSADLVNHIVTGDIANTMLSGLDQSGVHGLTLLPEGFRHLFSFGDPFLTPADLAGGTFRVPRSDTADAFFTALGATSDDLGGRPFEAAVHAGTTVGAESSFLLATDLPRSTATGNLVLYPKINSLVINSEVLNRLSATQQSLLRDAANDTQQWVLAHPTDEAATAKSFCDRGGRIVNAAASDLTAFEQAADPVYTELEADGATKELITKIRDLKQHSQAPVTVEECAPPATTPAAAEPPPVSSPTPVSNASTDATVFPDGVYRLSITADELVAAGADRKWSNDVAGVWTLTFDHGTLDLGGDPGRYCVSNARLSIAIFGADDVCGDGFLFSATWTTDGDTLRFANVVTAPGEEVQKALFGSKPWKKIG